MHGSLQRGSGGSTGNTRVSTRSFYSCGYGDGDSNRVSEVGWIWPPYPSPSASGTFPPASLGGLTCGRVSHWDDVVSAALDTQIVATRKKLTVFFSDVVSCTEINDQLESEELAGGERAWASSASDGSSPGTYSTMDTL